jgi:NAD(P)-dependent dehydrogenase (short-subunit alcohol dehydrogenase family)
VRDNVASQIDLPAESRGLAPGRGRMDGRRILVVGAGQTDVGIPEQPIGNGRAIAVLLGREGAHVVAADRDEITADGTVELIRRDGGRATTVVADVAEPASVEGMIVRSRQSLGGLDGVVYNVGIPGAKGWEATTPESRDTTMDVNLRGAMLTMRAALPVLASNSSVVFISAIAALRPTGQRLAYEASKAALAALMRATATAGKERAIRANVAMLGLIDTGLGRSANQTDNRASIPIPLGRHGTAWEVAYTVLFLLSHESAYVTGQTIAVDGGRTTL